MIRYVFFFVCLATMAACTTDHPRPSEEQPKPTATPPPPSVREHSYQIVKTLPHDPKAFTQGLVVYKAGMFLESTGQNGQSSIRHVRITDGAVQRIERLESIYFGEGATILGGKAYMLTWLNQTGFIYDAATLKKEGTFRYSGEGWGITNDGTNLVMSNGTNMLTVLDPSSFQVVRTVSVTLNGSPISNLNELEWIDGEIWANVWQTDRIVRIDPASGEVRGIVDLAGLLPTAERTADVDVLNGIAYDSVSKALYVTGKNWPHVYEIKVQ